MARKDTINALIKRGISEETAEFLLKEGTGYKNMSEISHCTEEELVEYGLNEEEARSVLAKIGTKKSASTSSRAKKKVEEEVEAVPMEEVTNFYQYNETELRLKGFLDELQLELPMKVVVDIAARIEGHEVSDDKCKELLTRASDMYQRHRMDQNESA